MNSKDFIIESALSELADELPSLSKHNYNAIDSLTRKIAKKYKINKEVLANLFSKKYKKIPSEWISGKLDEADTDDIDLEAEIDQFVDWAVQKLNIKSKPVLELSYDTEEAQTNHHTGSHVDKTNKIWVYVKNRNLVDILRTVFHELVHVRQGELNMIKPGSSYPGSPIEVMADMLAGKYIKIYGEKHHNIFQ